MWEVRAGSILKLDRAEQAPPEDQLDAGPAEDEGPFERTAPFRRGCSPPPAASPFFPRTDEGGAAGVFNMLANAFFVATVIFLALAFTLMGQLRFLIPWRALLWHEYWRGILFYCFLLFTNILGLTIWVERKLWLRDTGRKLKHLDQEIHSGQSELSNEILARFGDE